MLFEIISYFWRKEEFSLFSLILLTLGTIGAFIALQTGEAAAEITDKITGIGSILHEHEETAELVFYIYLGIVIFKISIISCLVWGYLLGCSFSSEGTYALGPTILISPFKTLKN